MDLKNPQGKIKGESVVRQICTNSGPKGAISIEERDRAFAQAVRTPRIALPYLQGTPCERGQRCVQRIISA